MARYEVNIKGKSIDLVFEKEDEIWLIEAKKKLNYEALGQILTYQKLYHLYLRSSKNVKLGIVCEETDPDIEAVCKEHNIYVFVLKEAKGKQGEESLVGEGPICGICGNRMIKEEGQYKCKTCEYFFGMSSIIRECEKCKGKYGTYPAIENDVLVILGMGSKHFRKMIEGLCPKCRSFGYVRDTIARLIKDMLEERRVTPYTLRTILPKEFIDYCLGKIEIFK